jgi:hypothetical protein
VIFSGPRGTGFLNVGGCPKRLSAVAPPGRLAGEQSLCRLSFRAARHPAQRVLHRHTQGVDHQGVLPGLAEASHQSFQEGPVRIRGLHKRPDLSREPLQALRQLRGPFVPMGYQGRRLVRGEYVNSPHLCVGFLFLILYPGSSFSSSASRRLPHTISHIYNNYTHKLNI